MDDEILAKKKFVHWETKDPFDYGETIFLIFVRQKINNP